MAVVETVQIDGNAQGFNEAIQELNKRIEELESTIKTTNKKAERGFEKTEKSVKGVGDQIKKTGNGVKNLVKNLGGLALLSSLADGAKEVFGQNQRLVDTLNEAVFSLQFAISGVIEAFATGDMASIPNILKNARKEGAALVRLQKEAALAEADRAEIQMFAQMLAEEQRQIRDDERVTIKERNDANERLNFILTKQLGIEEALVRKKVEAAQAEYDKIKNIENLVALTQAETELLDVEERILSQQSEYLSNNLALTREGLELTQASMEYNRIVAEGNLEYQTAFAATEVERLRRERLFTKELFDIELKRLNNKISTLTEGTLAHEEALNERAELELSYARESRQISRDLEVARAEAIQGGLDMASSSLTAFDDLQKSLAGESEQEAKKAFELSKALQLAQAIANTASAVTAQLAVPQDALTGANFVKAGIALTTGLAQIATIQRTQFETADSTASSLQGSVGASPTFNVVGRGNVNQLQQAVGSQFDQPIRAYVVGGDVLGYSELQRRRIRTATFG